MERITDLLLPQSKKFMRFWDKAIEMAPNRMGNLVQGRIMVSHIMDALYVTLMGTKLKQLFGMPRYRRRSILA